MSERKRLLIVYHTQSGNTGRLAAAVLRGAQRVAEVDSVMKRAFDAGSEDLLGCDALLLGTPENFGYMSGALKDFFDRTYYPCEGRLTGLPFAVFVSAGNDGTGAVREIGRIANGYGWKAVAVHAPLTGKGRFDQDPWQLYHVDKDRSESKDLAKENPEKPQALIKTWFEEADKNMVLPLDDRNATELFAIERPVSHPDRTRCWINKIPVVAGVAWRNDIHLRAERVVQRSRVNRDCDVGCISAWVGLIAIDGRCRVRIDTRSNRNVSLVSSEPADVTELNEPKISCRESHNAPEPTAPFVCESIECCLQRS